MSVFEEHDGVVYENDTRYISDGSGGLKRSGPTARVTAFRRGPRGGRHTIFAGSLMELDEEIEILLRLRRHARVVPAAVSAEELARRKRRNAER